MNVFLQFCGKSLRVWYRVKKTPVTGWVSSLVAQLVKNPRAIQETWIWSLGWEDPPEKAKATHSSILACIIHGVAKNRTRLSDFHFPFLSAWIQFSSVQSLSHVWLFVTPWITTQQAALSITNSRRLLKLMSTESVIPSSHLMLCHPLLLLPTIFPSIRVFSNESALHIRWPKYWSFSYSISPSNEHPGLISFRVDWLDLLAVQRTLKSLLQHHSSNSLN